MARDLTPVHPELRRQAALFPRLYLNRWTVRPIQWLTKAMPKSRAPSGIRVDEVAIPGRDPHHRIRLRIYRPADAKPDLPVLMWMHGGGLIIGSPQQNDRALFELVRALGIVVVSVDYRLAPQHPFPAPLEDCYTALKWVHSHPCDLGIDPNRIAIGGESAGGGLAASVAQLAHDQGEVRLALQLLVYPMLDDRSALRTDVPHADLLIWTQRNNRFGWESYLRRACGSDNLPPYAVPARRADLSGLPPAWIGVGALDLFLDENVDYARRLQRDGVDCQLLTVTGAFHGFDQFDRKLSVVQQFRQSQADALRKHLDL